MIFIYKCASLIVVNIVVKNIFKNYRYYQNNNNKLQHKHILYFLQQRMIRTIGGITPHKHVRNAMRLTIADTLAYQMTWTNKKNKIETQSMKFTNLIIGIWFISYFFFWKYVKIKIIFCLYSIFTMTIF